MARFVPADLQARTYREPFVGAGSLFFFLRPRRAILSDLNRDLIESYRAIRRHPALIARYLTGHASLDSEAHYYAVRQLYNRTHGFSPAQAARFIYLNRTCFNGIFRVNQAGDFNVPYGQKNSPILPDYEHLRAASSALWRAQLRAQEFESALGDAAKGDFVYLDPPYPPLNGTSFFTHYTSQRFPHHDQQRLAGIARELDQAGCLILMSNADLSSIRRLYSGLNFTPLRVTRYVKTAHRGIKVSEVIITNYEVGNDLLEDPD